MKIRRRLARGCSLGVFVLGGCGSGATLADQVVTSTSTALALSTSSPSAPAPIIAATVIGEFPHDPLAFTQGLIVAGDAFVESTGLIGSSSLRRVDIDSGRVEISVPNTSGQFAEGLAQLGDQLFQLTWRSEVGYVYDVATLELTATRTFTGEGWGLTARGTQLVMSDGSASITFRSPDTFNVIKTIEVTDGVTPIDQLNELEMVQGELWANVWLTTRIARIDPATGTVLGWIDVTALRPDSSMADPAAVANGIAYDAAANRLFVTGKRWDTIYEIAVPDPLLAG